MSQDLVCTSQTSRFQKKILEVETEIEKVKEEKSQVVRSQRYEEAARLRDRERQLQESLEAEKKSVGRRKSFAPRSSK